ncbi:hypothetical protein PTKIN_Ptkin11bG0156000 [Pterospermum kingtungense]
MASKAMAIATVLLRIFTILFAVGCVVVLILDKFEEDGDKATFKDIISYRYVLATAAIAAAYNLLQLPFAIYYACTEKRLIRGDFLPAVDFYADKVIAFVVASGVGAGFLVTKELKELFGDSSKKLVNFFNKGYIATGLLAGAFLCMVLLAILSSVNGIRNRGSRNFFK